MTDPGEPATNPAITPELTEQDGSDQEWFDDADPTGQTTTGEHGLRFSCTQCGECCSGTPGYVGFTDEEAVAIAAHLKISVETFMDEYTRDTPHGRSIKDLKFTGSNGHDCVFLDRTSRPGMAGCSIYKIRPTQCRTWPFWGSNLTSRETWNRSGESCPGLNKGPLHTAEHVRLTRERVEI